MITTGLSQGLNGVVLIYHKHHLVDEGCFGVCFRHEGNLPKLLLSRKETEDGSATSRTTSGMTCGPVLNRNFIGEVQSDAFNCKRSQLCRASTAESPTQQQSFSIIAQAGLHHKPTLTLICVQDVRPHVRFDYLLMSKLINADPCHEVT